MKKIWHSQLIYFRNYRLRKTWLDRCLKTPVLEGNLTSKMVNGPKHSPNPWRQHLYHICWSMLRKLNWKNYLLLICKILGLPVNTLTADDKYSLLKRENLTQPIQMQLSKKETFLNFFLDSWNLDQTLNILKGKMIFTDYVFPTLQTPKDLVRR